MGKNRLIEEKYWSQFMIKVDDDSKTIKHDGHMFEELIKSLLHLMYSDMEWEPTKMTHDGNKDFKAKDGNEIYWAECKNYKTKIDLKTLAATLVMAEIENVNSVLFFCYSEINNNTKTKLNSFSISNQKTIYFFDGIVLDQLILKYKDEILPKFFPDLKNVIEKGNFFTNIPQSTVLCYLERNPFFNGTPEFDMKNLLELQDLKLGEVIGIHIVIINSDLNKEAIYSIEANFSESGNAFELISPNYKDIQANKMIFNTIELPAGATRRKSIYLKLQSRELQVGLPSIICKCGTTTIRNFRFPPIRTLRTRQTAFLGHNYVEQRDYICKACLNQKRLSIIYIYGSSGTGKSRMILECSTKFLSQGYHIVKLVNSSQSEHLTYTMLRELIFSLYGFTDELIEYVIQNSYEKLNNYNDDTYKEIFRIIKNIYKNRNSLSQINTVEYNAIYEKMAKEKYFFIVDDIQYWDDCALSFLKGFYYYALDMQRKCNAVIAIAANTDILYNQQTMEFLAEIISKQNDFESNICSYNLTGFETVNQSYLFLKEILGIDDDFEDIETITNFSRKPKYIAEVANYLQDINAIEYIHNKAVITNRSFFKESLKTLPKNIKAVLDKRWNFYLEKVKTEQQDYKKIISCILFLENVNVQKDFFGVKHQKEIENLYQYGFLKKNDLQDEIYTFDHDSIKFYFQEYYKDWFETAVSYSKNSTQNMLNGNCLECICDLYQSNHITLNNYNYYMSLEIPSEVKYKVIEYILVSVLENGIDEIFFIIKNIMCNVREQFGEKRAELFYRIFEKKYIYDNKKLSNKEYCIILMDYAENQLKLKSTERATKLYDKILNQIAKESFPESEYMTSQIYNRYFVCGRVGGTLQQYIEKLGVSMEIAVNRKFCDLCIENYFDKAQSLFLDINSIGNAIRYLEIGCSAYNELLSQNLQNEESGLYRLNGQYLYRSVQLSFLRKDYKTLEKTIWKYNEEIISDKKIEFKLYFRIQFLIFKITFCLLGKHKCSDFEMKYMLDQLNMFQSMQNKLQLYRYYYLCGKYNSQEGNWEKAYILYKKAFDNLDENKCTEEIFLQRQFIAQDMIINFRKRGFPFNQYDMSWLDIILKNSTFKDIMYSSDQEFEKFFDNYIPLVPLSNEQTKEGYLLF